MMLAGIGIAEGKYLHLQERDFKWTRSRSLEGHSSFAHSHTESAKVAERFAK
jgi:hypothetical protein